MPITTHNGHETSRLFGILLLGFMIGGVGCLGRGTEPPSTPPPREEQATPSEEGAMMEKKDEAGAAMVTYQGSVLAGTSAKLLDFHKADYDAALATDKLIVLYFYATWCPICAAELPELYAAFNELTTDQVIGFRVNYNDSDTDDDERALAREFGVAYQHTKVFVKNAARILKAPDSWRKARYLEEIARARTQ